MEYGTVVSNDDLSTIAFVGCGDVDDVAWIKQCVGCHQVGERYFIVATSYIKSEFRHCKFEKSTHFVTYLRLGTMGLPWHGQAPAQ